MNEEVRRRVDTTKAQELNYLDLRGLELEEVPQEILEVPWIGALALSNNKISDITLLEKMSNLHKLALTNNCIEDISVLEKMPKLRFIFLANNLIKDISKINSQPRLKKLVAHGNKISFLPDLSHFTILVYLDLGDNPLACPTFKEMKAVVPSLLIYKY